MTIITPKPQPPMDHPTDGVERLPKDPRKVAGGDESRGFGMTLGDMLKALEGELKDSNIKT